MSFGLCDIPKELVHMMGYDSEREREATTEAGTQNIGRAKASCIVEKRSQNITTIASVGKGSI